MLRRAGEFLLASNDKDLVEVGTALVAASTGDCRSLDRALGLVRGPGQRSVKTLAAQRRRAAMLVVLHREWGMTPAQIEGDLSRYFSGEFRHHRQKDDCPKTLLGTRREFLWHALKAIPTPIKAPTIKEIISAELRLFGRAPMADNDNVATTESADAYLPIQVSNGLTR
jgi:hypothetical protein